MGVHTDVHKGVHMGVHAIFIAIDIVRHYQQQADTILAGIP